MRYRFFRIPAHGGDEERELNEFIGSHRVTAVDREFISDASMSAWAVCIAYLEGPEQTPARKGKLDYREVLTDAEFAVFAKLRSLRKQLAERDGVPPYALFTNEQLAVMVQRGVRSKAELAEVDGVGAARVAKYGEAFLAALASSPAQNGAGRET